MAIIFSHKKNKPIAVGLYDPHSPIRIKLLHFGGGLTLDSAWFKQKIEQAYQVRLPLLQPSQQTNSYRLIHGENDGLPSLVCDVYNRVGVLKLYSLIWLPYLATLVSLLQEQSNCDTLVLRLSRNVQKQTTYLHQLYDGQILLGNLAQADVIFKEHGLLFSANVVAGHKTGYFLDHRHNRKRIGFMAKRKTVLDIFAYAGGFSVHALAGGATKVVSIDISQQALAMAKRNAQLNFSKYPEKRHQLVVDDAFEAMIRLRNQRQQFDIVVVDPPSFAKSEREIPRALLSYTKLCKLAMPLVKRGGVLLMASCSSRVSSRIFYQTIQQAVYASKIPFRIIHKSQHDIDHPIGFAEGAYLKAVYYQLLA